MARLSVAQAGNTNRLAFLDMLAMCEIGRKMLDDPASDDGYRVIVGSLPGNMILAPDYHDHPQHQVWLPNQHRYGTAAGRYMFIAKTWDGLVEQFHFPDFSPANQDLGALALIRECRAMDLVDIGRIEDAMARCHEMWASLPGSTATDQHQQSVAFCINAYHDALLRYHEAPDFSNVRAGVRSTAPET